MQARSLPRQLPLAKLVFQRDVADGFREWDGCLLLCEPSSATLADMHVLPAYSACRRPYSCEVERARHPRGPPSRTRRTQCPLLTLIVPAVHVASSVGVSASGGRTLLALSPSVLSKFRSSDQVQGLFRLTPTPSCVLKGVAWWLPVVSAKFTVFDNCFEVLRVRPGVKTQHDGEARMRVITLKSKRKHGEDKYCL